MFHLPVRKNKIKDNHSISNNPLPPSWEELREQTFHTLLPKLPHIPLPIQHTRNTEINPDEDQRSQHGDIEWPATPRSTHDRKAKVDKTLGKVMGTDQLLKSRVYRKCILLEAGKVGMAIVLNPGTNDKEQDANEGLCTGRSNEGVDIHERKLESINRI